MFPSLETPVPTLFPCTNISWTVVKSSRITFFRDIFLWLSSTIFIGFFRVFPSVQSHISKSLLCSGCCFKIISCCRCLRSRARSNCRLRSSLVQYRPTYIRYIIILLISLEIVFYLEYLFKNWIRAKNINIKTMERPVHFTRFLFYRHFSLCNPISTK